MEVRPVVVRDRLNLGAKVSGAVIVYTAPTYPCKTTRTKELSFVGLRIC